MRTENWRYTRWQHYENPENIVAVELYDLSKTKLPDKNLANQKRYAPKVAELNELLTAELAKYSILKPEKK